MCHIGKKNLAVINLRDTLLKRALKKSISLRASPNEEGTDISREMEWIVSLNGPSREYVFTVEHPQGLRRIAAASDRGQHRIMNNKRKYPSYMIHDNTVPRVRSRRVNPSTLYSATIYYGYMRP